MTKVEKLQREVSELRAELESLQRRYTHLEGDYSRSNAAAASLIQDVVTFMGPGGLVPHSIYGSKLLAALGKATALLHGPS
jgi:prefoldin subunit 5